MLHQFGATYTSNKQRATPREIEMKTLKTSEPQKIGRFTVTPNASGPTVCFSFNNRGGNAKYNLNTGEFEKVRRAVGRVMEIEIEQVFIND